MNRSRGSDFNARPVFSSDDGRLGRDEVREVPKEGDGVVRVRREVAGRGGKTVTTVSGLPLAGAELKAVAKSLKQGCGTGGSVKDGVVEIQGDHRDRIVELLEKKGYTVRLSGG